MISFYMPEIRSLDCKHFDKNRSNVGYCEKKDKYVSKFKDCVDCKFEEIVNGDDNDES